MQYLNNTVKGVLLEKFSVHNKEHKQTAAQKKIHAHKEIK